MIDEQVRENVPNDRLSADEILKLELQELYEEQQRRLACPGCGEEAFLG